MPERKFSFRTALPWLVLLFLAFGVGALTANWKKISRRLNASALTSWRRHFSTAQLAGPSPQAQTDVGYIPALHIKVVHPKKKD